MAWTQSLEWKLKSMPMTPSISFSWTFLCPTWMVCLLCFVNIPIYWFLLTLFVSSSTGLCATSLIRKFDLKTPIISMTSNFQPLDVLKYIDIGRLCNHGLFFLLSDALWSLNSAQRYEWLFTQTTNQRGDDHHVASKSTSTCLTKNKHISDSRRKLAYAFILSHDLATYRNRRSTCRIHGQTGI